MKYVPLKYLPLSLLLLAAPAATQQQQTPSQVAIQVCTIIGQWAQVIEALQAENAKLKAEIAELKKGP